MDGLPDQERKFSKLFFNKRRPLFLSLFFLFLVIVVIVLIFFAFLTTPNLPPQEIRVSNQTESSLTLSWVTNRSVNQKIYYSQSPLKLSQLLLAKIMSSPLKVAEEDFGPAKTTVHHVSLENLEPESQYFFVVNNGWRFYLPDSQNQALPEAKTTSALSSPPPPYPCYGTVYDFAQETPLDPVVVYLSSEGSNLLSTFTNSTGNYSFDLSTLRSANFDEPLNLSQNPNLILEFQGGLWGNGKQPLYPKSCQPITTMVLE